MNERIKELANRAMVEREDGWHEFDPYVFAELIVKECIAQCETNKDHEWLGSGSKLSAFNIREHFGVEE